jgi:hypothetical protein
MADDDYEGAGGDVYYDEEQYEDEPLEDLPLDDQDDEQAQLLLQQQQQLDIVAINGDHAEVMQDSVWFIIWRERNDQGILGFRVF